MDTRQIDDPMVRTVLREFREGLEQLYGDRLAHLILFGSRARGDARPDSDIDVMIVLKGRVDQWAERTRVSELASRVSLEHDVVILCMYASDEEFANRVTPLLENVRRDGVAA